jgi:hypothetical protein
LDGDVSRQGVTGPTDKGDYPGDPLPRQGRVRKLRLVKFNARRRTDRWPFPAHTIYEDWGGLVMTALKENEGKRHKEKNKKAVSDDMGA